MRSTFLKFLPFLMALAAALVFWPPPQVARADEGFTIAILSPDAGPEALPAIAQLTTVPAPPPLPSHFDPSNTELFAQAVLEAAHSPQKSLLVALALIFAVWFVREYGGVLAGALGWKKAEALFESDRAGPVFVLILSFLGAIAAALLAGQKPSPLLFLTAAGVALKAIGGFVAAKKITAPAK